MKLVQPALILTIWLLAHNAKASDTITLNLNLPTNPANIEINEQGYWVETYNNDVNYRHLEFNLFSLNHIPTGFGGTDVGNSMSYWDGFTYCTNGDSADYGVEGDSNGWLNNQWGCMAGGGIKTDSTGHVMHDANGNVMVQKGNPYLVAYWGYWVETQENGAPCLQINFTDNKPHRAVGVHICNHPWPYYGNIHGDGFASAFNDEGDTYKLIAHGLNAQGEDIGTTVTLILAEYKNGQLIQSPYWQWMDLSALGTVSAIYFTMESTDMHSIVELGPNTAVYFCLDRLQVLEYVENTAPNRPSGLTATPHESAIEMTWDSTANATSYNVFIDSAFITTTNLCQYTFTQLQAKTTYSLQVQAISADSLVSELAGLNATTTDETAPTTPTNLQATPSIYSIALTWDASTDNVAVDKYGIFVDEVLQKRTTYTSYTLTGLDSATTYTISIEACDASGNCSNRENVTISTLSGSTGIEVSNSKGSTTMYYSPTEYTIFVETDKSTRLFIYNIFGRLAYYNDVAVGNSNINISRLPKGVYIARCGNKTLKLIK